MENASKALLNAGGVLIAILIVSVSVDTPKRSLTSLIVTHIASFLIVTMKLYHLESTPSQELFIFCIHKKIIVL